MTQDEWNRYYPPQEKPDCLFGIWLLLAIGIMAFLALIVRVDFTKLILISLPTWGIQ